MENNYLNSIQKAARSKQLWKRVIALLSALVLIITSNQLKLKADTLEHLPACGLVEHQHSAECYGEAGDIVCGLEEHVHTDACFQARPTIDDELPVEEDALELDDEEVVEASEVETPAEEIDSFDLEGPEGEEPLPEADGEEAAVVVEALDTPVYDFNGASCVLLSDILAGAGLDLEENAIDAVGESVVDDDQQLSVSVAKDEDQYTVVALRDFIDDDMVELVVFTKDGEVYLVNLKNGILYEPVEAAVAEDQSAWVGNEESEEMPVAVEAGVEEQILDAAVEDEVIVEDQPIPVEDEVIVEDQPIPVEDEESDILPVPVDADVEEQTLVTAIEDEDAVEDEPIPVEDEAIVEDQPVAIEDEAVVEDQLVPVEDEAIVEDQPVPVEDEAIVEDEPIPVEDEAIVEDQSVLVEDEESNAMPASADVDPEEQTFDAAVEDEASELVIEQTDGEEKPVVDEATEEEENPVVDEATEEEEKPAEDEATEGEEKPAEDEATEDDEKPAVDEATEEEENPVVDEATEDEENPAEDETTEDEAQPVVDEATEDEEKSDEVEAIEDEAQPAGDEDSDQSAVDVDEEAPDEAPVKVYTATIDLAESATPFSLLQMMGAATAAEDLSAEEERQAEEAPGEGIEAPAPADWTLDYDDERFEVVFEEGDYLITPRDSFEAATIRVEAGDSYVLNLLNYQLPVAYPAQRFEGITATMTVKVTAEEGAFPEGTTMEVFDVEDEATISDIASTVEDDNTSVNRVHAVDITFRDAEGEEIEPLIPISVVMNVNEQTQSADAVVVHMDNDGNTEVVEQTGEGEAVAFDAEAFSIYAVVVTEKYISADGERYSVQVSYNSEAGIPDGATLRVSEVDASGYVDKAAEALGPDKAVRLARFFDITILAGGREIQPDGAVTVKVTLDENVENDDVKAVHFGEDVTVLNVEEDAGTLSFQAESFSVYGIVYSVDFEWTDAEGKAFAYSMEGGSELLLSDLLAALHIKADLTGSYAVFSNSALVRLTPVRDEDYVTLDWTLTSLEPFDTKESLIVTLANGTKLYIVVTDAQEISIKGDEITIRMLSGANQVANGDGYDMVWDDVDAPDEGHAFSFRVNYTFSTDTVHKRRWEKDQIEILLPKSILRDRDGNPADEFNISMPRYDADGLTSQNVFVYDDSDDKYIRIYNRVPADPTQAGYLEFSYTTTKETFDYYDYLSANDNPAVPTARLIVYNERYETDEQGNTVTIVDKEAQPLVDKSAAADPVHIDTTAEIKLTDKKNPKKYVAWDSSWGTEPDTDGGTYVYVLWTVESKIEATQPFDFTLKDAFTASDERITGDVVGYRYAGESTFTEAHVVHNVTAPNGTMTRTDYVLTRHDLSEFAEAYNRGSTYIIRNQVDATVTPVDGVDRPTMKSDNEAFSDKKPAYTAPAGGGMGAEKKGLEPNFNLTAFENNNIGTLSDLKYRTAFSGNGWYYTYQFVDENDAVPTDEEGNALTDPGRESEAGRDYFGKKKAAYSIHDDTLWLLYKDKGAVEYRSERLVPGDYQFDSVTFSYTFRDGIFKEETQQYETQKDMTPAEQAAALDNGRLGDITFTLWQNDTPVNGAITYSLRDGTFSGTGDAADLLNSGASSGRTLVFADGANITGYTLSNENAFYYTRLEAIPSVSLKRSSSGDSVLEAALGELKGFELDEDAMELWNTAHFAVLENDAEVWSADRSGYDDILGNTSESVLKKSFTNRRNDTVRSLYYIDWLVEMQETYTMAGETNFVNQPSGTFYDLLPMGNEYVANTLVVYADGQALDAGQYTSKVYSNYNDSGRALLVVSINAAAEGAYSMEYQTSMTWNAILEERLYQGSTNVKAHNVVIYETGNDAISEYKVWDGRGLTTQGNDYELADTYVLQAQLYEPDGVTKQPDVISYAYDCPVVALVSGSLGLQKLVRATNVSARYAKSAVTYAGGEYSYRLTFGPHEGSKAKDMILYDFLENWTGTGEDDHSAWHGIIESVDTRLTQLSGVKPVVYFSTVERETLKAYAADFEDDSPTFDNLKDTDIWTLWTEESVAALVNGKQDITAIAVDLRKDSQGQDFELKGGRTLSVTVYLNAPETGVEAEENGDAITYNEVYLHQQMTDDVDGAEYAEGEVIEQGHTEVFYRIAGDLKLRKASSISAATGIQGVTFRISGTSVYGTHVDVTATSVDGGWLTFRNLEMSPSDGYYELQEISGVDDYVVDDTVLKVRVNNDGTAQIIGTAESDVLPEHIIDIQALKSAEAPQAGESASSVEQATEEELINDINYRINNTPRAHGDLVFTKRGARDGSDSLEALKGTSFRLTSDPTTYYGKTVDETAVSDAQGRVSFPNIERGSYILRELIATDGYVQANRTFTVTVDANGKISMALNGADGEPLADGDIDEDANVQLRIESLGASDETDMLNDYTVIDEPLHKLGLMKVDNMSGKMLSGARFTLTGTSDNGTVVNATEVSAITGEVTFDRLEAGTYYLQEVEAPEKHVLDSTIYTVRIEADGRITLTWEKNGETLTACNYEIVTDETTGETTTIIHPVGTSGGDNVMPDDITKAWFYTYYRRFGFPNPRVENGMITVTKQWLDESGDPMNATPADAPIPVVQATTTVPKDIQKPAMIDKAKWDQVLPTSNDNVGTLGIRRNQVRSFSKVAYPDDLTGWTEIGVCNDTYPNHVYIRYSESDGALQVCSDAADVYLPEKCGHWGTGRGLFSNFTNVTSIDLRGLKSDMVNDMDGMFNQCNNLVTVDLSEFNTERVTNMTNMFNMCTKLTTIKGGLENFRTPRLEHMYCMFKQCKALPSINVSSFDTSKVDDVNNVFAQCIAAEVINVTGWDTGNMKNMSCLFDSCNALKTLDLSSFDTHSATNVATFFASNEKLKTVYVSEKWDLTNIPANQNLFYNTNMYKLEGGNGTIFSETTDALKQTKKYARYTDTVYDKTDPDTWGYFTYKAFTTPNDTPDPGEPVSDTSDVALSNSADAKITSQRMYTGGGDSGEVFDQWIDNGDGTWTYRFHVYEGYSIRETDGQLYDEDSAAVYDANGDAVKLTFSSDADRQPVYDAETGKYVIHADDYDIVAGELFYRGTQTPVYRQDTGEQVKLASYNVQEVTELNSFSYLDPYTQVFPAGEYYRNLVYLVSRDPELNIFNNATVQNRKTKTTPEYGTLSLVKVVEGEAPNSNESFSFTVTIDGTAQEVSLKAGESKFWTVEVGKEWRVEENLTDEQKKHYQPSISNNRGTITAKGQRVTVTATNTVKQTTGDLSITKRVVIPEGREEDPDAAFSFVVELWTEGAGGTKTPVTGTYSSNKGAITFVSDESGKTGVSKTSIALKHDETITVKGLPIGTKYAVREVDIDALYALTRINEDDVSDASDPEATGEITAATAEALFTNTKTKDEERGGFKLTKRLGENTDTEEYFTFMVQFSGLKANKTYTYRIVTPGDGGAEPTVLTRTFKSDASGAYRIDSLALRAGQVADFSRAVTGLPANADITITEQASDYIAAYEIDTTPVQREQNTDINKPLTGAVKVVKDTDVTVTYTNTEPVYHIGFAKQAPDGVALPGAELALYSIVIDEDAQTYTHGATPDYAFTSATQERVVPIRPGSYILTELKAPAGYELTWDVRVDVSEAGKVSAWSVERGTLTRLNNVTEPEEGQAYVTEYVDIENRDHGSVHIVMVDKPYTFSVLKKDATADGASVSGLPGATLVIVDDKGNPVIDPWVTTADPKVISGGLEVGKEYWLKEVSAPQGYATAEPIKFKLVEENHDGATGAYLYAIVDNNAEFTKVDGLTLVMEDEPIFQFIKEWRDALGEAMFEGWQRDITVHIHRKYSDTERDEAFDHAYTIGMTGDALTCTPSGSYKETMAFDTSHDIRTGYQFIVKGLPTADESERTYIYYVTEDTVDGYQNPVYIFGSNENLEGAPDGGVIQNRIVSVALPATGGPGTTLFTVSGLSLIGLALACLLRKKRQY